MRIKYLTARAFTYKHILMIQIGLKSVMYRYVCVMDDPYPHSRMPFICVNGAAEDSEDAGNKTHYDFEYGDENLLMILHVFVRVCSRSAGKTFKASILYLNQPREKTSLRRS